MPIWVTLALFIGGAVGTYFIAPRINQEFEKQKMTSAFITSNLESMNSLTRNFLSDLSVYNNKLLDDNFSKDLQTKLLSKTTELQWRIIEFEIIFEDEASKKIILEYKMALDRIRTAVEKKDPDKILETAPQYLGYSRKIIKMLAGKAGLTLHEISEIENSSPK